MNAGFSATFGGKQLNSRRIQVIRGHFYRGEKGTLSSRFNSGNTLRVRNGLVPSVITAAGLRLLEPTPNVAVKTTAVRATDASKEKEKEQANIDRPGGNKQNTSRRD
jgi:hypothetical protein